MDEAQLEPRLFDLLTVAHRVIGRSLQAQLESEEGVTVDQWRTLRTLSSDTGRTMGELVERLQIPAASLTRLVDGLVDRSLVFRHAGPVDRRRIEVFLSGSGSALQVRLEELVRVHERRYRQTPGLAVNELIAALGAIVTVDPGAPVSPRQPVE